MKITAQEEAMKYCKECGCEIPRQDELRAYHYQDRMCERCRNAAEVRKAKVAWYAQETKATEVPR
jgi:hypothetical protein